MLRYLLVLLAIIVAVLAVLFDRLWLRVGAGVAIVTALALWGWRFWEALQDEEEETQPRPTSTAPDKSLEELGIVDIRPEGQEAPEAEDPSTGAEGESGGVGAPSVSSTSRTSGQPPPTEAAPDPPGANAAPDAGEATGAEASPHAVRTKDAPVLAPFLQSVRAVLEAQTVCLLVQEEVALTYRIEALASTHSDVRQRGEFNTQTPLLTASMSRKSVSVRPLTESEVAIEDLGYYGQPPKVNQLAVAPVPQPDTSSTTFLLADATAESDLGRSRARTLLEHFAETVALLSAGPEVDGAQTGAEAEGTGATTSPGATSDADAVGGEAPRPRREIIAEEMEASETASEDLALILVHLNRAESIARRGEEAVASAERLLRARLEQMSPNHRVEQFGELTYGIFFRGAPGAIEPWVADLKAEMAQEEGELEGGVSVGAAVWNDPDEEPEGLRAAATDALHEAYKTGTSTIVT